MFSTRHGLPKRGDRKAAAVVEFAVLAPVFVILIVGTISASKAIHATAVMAQALREGGRLAAMDWSGALPAGTSPNDKVIRDVRNFMSAAGVDASTVEITITYADGPNAGAPFELGDPDNFLELFEIRAHRPHAADDVWSSYLTEGRGLTARIVLRAGRSTSG